ncbi:hypothetical protein A9R00_02920, partial [Oleispira antarctica]
MKKTLLFFFLLLSLINSNTFAAISYVTSVTDKGNDERASLTVPASTQAGDILIVQVTFRNEIGSDGVTTPAGWILIAPQDRDGAVFQSVYYKVAVAADAGSSYEWDFDGNGNRRYILGMSVFSGVDNTTPIAAENSATDGVFWGSLTAPSVTTVNSNSMLLALYTIAAGDQSFSAGVGMTEAYDIEENNNNNGITSMTAWELFSTVAATGSRVATASKNFDDGIGHLIALNEGSAAPEITSVVTACGSLNTVEILFSQDLDPTTAQDILNYDLTSNALSSLGISSAVLSATDTVILTLTTDMNDLTPYTLTVNNVENLTGDAIAANSTSEFMLSCNLNCITDNFVGPGSLSSSWSVGHSNGSFGDPRIVDDGRLRLTDSSNQVSTVATLLNQFPGADNRIEIEFDYYAYDGNSADGIAINFSDASISPAAGAFGGSLGYAQKTGIDGFAGGWLGVGIDEYGNFSAASEGREGGPGRTINSISLRGSGSGTSGYPYLTGTSSISPAIDDSGSTPNPGHRYRIIVDHTAGGSIATASVERDTGSGYSALVPTFNIYTQNPLQDAVPANWVVSFTGSTGGSTNIHEIGDLKICAAQPIQTFSQVDHYEITHTTPGLTCEGSEVTITAHDSSHTDVTVLSDTSISVTTNPIVTAIVNSPVVMLAGTSSTSIYLQQASLLNDININVDDGNKTDDDGSLEDPWISFVDTAFRFYAAGNNTDTTPINPQISGKPSITAPGNQGLALRAIRTNTDTGACEVGLTGTQTVDIAYRCKDPAVCSAAQLSFFANGNPSIVGTNNADSLTYTSADMTFDATGSAPFSFNFPDAGLVDLHASLAVSATTIPPNPAFTLVGSSNQFVVRPFAFELLFDANSTAADASGSKFVSAGADFSMQVRAVNWQAADDGDNDGLVDIDGTSGVVADLSDNSATLNFGQENNARNFTPTHTLDQPSTSAGTLTSSAVIAGGTSSHFNNGVSTTDATLNWDEVGIIDINLILDNYLSAAGANIIGQANNIGRFYPAQFIMTLSSTTNSCGSFSYMGQTAPDTEFDIRYTLEAHKTGGGLTQNYTGAFAKATPADHINIVAENNNDGGSYQSRLENLADDAWLNGQYIYSDSGYFSRGIVVDGPYQLLQLGIQFTDNDGDLSVLPGLDMKANSSADCNVVGDCDAWLIDNLDVRFGQLKLSNVFGPETFALDMAVQTEYFDGDNFILNTDDSCTSLVVTDPPLSPRALSWTGNLAAGETTPSLTSDITAGLGVIQFSEAGLGNEGSVIFEYD